MSTDIEKNKDEISESATEKVKALFEQIATAGDAPEGLLDVLKKMSDDPDLAELLQSPICLRKSLEIWIANLMRKILKMYIT